MSSAQASTETLPRLNSYTKSLTESPIFGPNKTPSPILHPQTHTHLSPVASSTAKTEISVTGEINSFSYVESQQMLQKSGANHNQSVETLLFNLINLIQSLDFHQKNHISSNLENPGSFTAVVKSLMKMTAFGSAYEPLKDIEHKKDETELLWSSLKPNAKQILGNPDLLLLLRRIENETYSSTLLLKLFTLVASK